MESCRVYCESIKRRNVDLFQAGQETSLTPLGVLCLSIGWEGEPRACILDWFGRNEGKEEGQKKGKGKKEGREKDGSAKRG